MESVLSWAVFVPLYRSTSSTDSTSTSMHVALGSQCTCLKRNWRKRKKTAEADLLQEILLEVLQEVTVQRLTAKISLCFEHSDSPFMINKREIWQRINPVQHRLYLCGYLFPWLKLHRFRSLCVPIWPLMIAEVQCIMRDEKLRNVSQKKWK